MSTPTKSIKNYLSYEMNNWEVRIYKGNKREFWRNKVIFDYDFLAPRYRDELQPILDFIEAESNHKFVPPEDEVI